MGQLIINAIQVNLKITPTCDTNELSKCDSEALINTYDNTLLYTDYLLSEIIKLLKEQKAMKVLCFIFQIMAKVWVKMVFIFMVCLML